ncbi:MAG: hypothetical protein ACFUZC_16210 [Chthoniobacteraceae bacterium]
MNNSEHSFWWHNDGMFRFRKPVLRDPIQPVPQSAREVIEAFRERNRIWSEEAGARRKIWEALPEAEKTKPWVVNPLQPRTRKPWDRLKPEEIQAEEEYMRALVEQRDRQPDRFKSVWQSLEHYKISEENQCASASGVFLSPNEPDYPDIQTASYCHESFCWEVALRSAFRVLDLFEIKDTEFPSGWLRVNCSPSHPNYSSLVASASYQMGTYFIKAQAMQRVPQIYRASKMTRTRNGKYDPMGEAVMEACGEIRAMGLSLQGNSVATRVLKLLESQGRATLNPPTIGGEDVHCDKICRYIAKYRKANGLGTTRSAKTAR